MLKEQAKRKKSPATLQGKNYAVNLEELKVVYAFRLCISLFVLVCVMNSQSVWSQLTISNFKDKSGTFVYAQDGGYWWDTEGQDDGTNQTGDGLTINASANHSRLLAGFNNVYPPFSGKYRMRLRWCPDPSGLRTLCTIANSSGYIDSDVQTLQSSVILAQQEAEFTLPAGASVPATTSICYTFVDESGGEWSTSAMRTCQDGGRLPETPADCYLNHNSDLDVDLGVLERSKIAITPVYGSTGNIKKDVAVLCIRDANINISTSFQFTPLIVKGDEVISTSLANIGVAIFYQGKLVGPSSEPIIEDYSSGYTFRELEFQAVRNPDSALKDIPTGDFTASAVMVMTEQ